MPEKGYTRTSKGFKQIHSGRQWYRACEEEGCWKYANKTKKCDAHGGGRTKLRCKVEGCERVRANNGVCFTHGAVAKKCKEPGCKNISLKSGACRQHGAVFECKEPGCTTTPYRKGVCVRHGAKLQQCKIEGCTTAVRKYKLCFKHGGFDKCKFEGCENSAINNYLCMSHGCKVKICKIKDCDKQVEKENTCRKHHPNYVEKFATFSKMACECFDQIEEHFGIKIQHVHYNEENKLEGEEFRPPEWKLKPVDGYCNETNTIYEFMGQEWHGYPPYHYKYGLGKYNMNGELYDDLFHKTMKNMYKLKSFGYNVVYIWEDEYKHIIRIMSKENLQKVMNEEIIEFWN